MHFVGMPKGGFYRAGRWADVETYPPPSPPVGLAAPRYDGFRWEDPLGEFATVRCSLTAEAAIGRIIARYRRRVVDDEGTGIIDAIKRFMSGPPDRGEPEIVDGQVPADVFDDLYLIHVPEDRAVVFIDLEHPDTYESLKDMLEPVLDALNVPRLPRDLARERDRRITRQAIRALHSQYADGRVGPVAGIRIPGQPDPEWESYVLWSPPQLVPLVGEDIGFRWVARWDADLAAALARLDISLPPGPDADRQD
jgi:hypothetical protein